MRETRAPFGVRLQLNAYFSGNEMTTSLMNDAWLGMTYDEWEASIPEFGKAEVIWHVQAYRLALYLADAAERDTRTLANDPRFAGNVTQLIRAAGGISATIAEGYPRQSAKDRIRYYEYAAGSASEVKAWYLNSRAAVGDALVEERYAVLMSITRLLHTMIRTATNPTLTRTRTLPRAR